MIAKWCAVFVAAALLGGCTSETSAESGERVSKPESTSPTPTRTPEITEQLDSMAVLGHSGATGTLSDPRNPMRDARENSWATGDNPDVQSIYLRLLQDHPALEGHGYNLAANGTGVENLPFQVERLLAEADPLPDLVVIQTIDNDIRCDGSDPDNYGRYGQALDRVLAHMGDAIPGVRVYIVSQSITVKRWTTWAARHPDLVGDNTGTGPCDVFDKQGNPRPAGIRSMQRIVDAYWARIESVCAAHPGCFTDGGAQQARSLPADKYVAVDHNHASIEGHRNAAAIAWAALSDEIKQLP